LLRNLVAHAGLPTKFSRHGYAHETKSCYLNWNELQQLPAWQLPAHKASLMRQKDVFVARCLCTGGKRRAQKSPARAEQGFLV
jgi:hypothetical protein